MKRLIWAALLVSLYIWSTATGRDQFLLEGGKKLYHVLSAWFDDAELDFHMDAAPAAPTNKKKRSRLWD